ncbi:MAG TPA: hypothetical protein VLF71_05270 [Candidatus Saccharimonadales bacterium]|nr:hypothetical protein [Candidatus Saccharimonadales bacterium]
MAAILLACVPRVAAHAAGNDFTIQVSPSPLVVSLTPGQTQTNTVTIRNFSNHPETLEPSLSGINISRDSEKVSLTSTLPADISQWLHFSQPGITVPAGGTSQLTLTFATPTNVGFSYAVAVNLTSTRTTQSSSGAGIKPQVVVFCLININRSDAKSALSLDNFSSSKSRYAFLPADFSLHITNSGNTISQPSGNIFIQRSFGDSKPVATIPINPSGRYVLPGTARAFAASWGSGFPYYAAGKDGKRHLVWDWKHLSDFRIGKYVARAVVTYDNGSQDVPLTASLTFWVIPWWLVTLLALLVVIVVTGLLGWGWLIFKGTKKVRGYAQHRKK